VFGTKEDMQQHAAERVEDLKSRGFDQAGLYDPPGVGGTHVMYVLHHADQPQLYAGLAPDPHISSLVGLWKGVGKPIALAAMAFTALAGFFHFVRVGRNEIDEPDEAGRAAGSRRRAAAQRSATPRRATTGQAPMSDNERRATVERYSSGERTNHWLIALGFVLAALSGLALFHPALFWLSNLFGGGPWTRILHPSSGSSC